MKTRVAVLGATGLVGQHFLALLADHPWFEIVALGASARSVGQRYGDVAQWVLPEPLPTALAELEVVACHPSAIDAPLVFSALDPAVAGDIEAAFANAGASVVSNAKNHRYDPRVPIVIPEVNASHLSLVGQQKRKGWIATNPNCSAAGLAMALAPLHEAFGLDAVHVTTFQAISGGGYPGVPSLAIQDNVIPFVPGEEEKIEREIPKILGNLLDGSMIPAPITVSAQCHRVPVSHGHLEAVGVKLATPASREEVMEAWHALPGLNLPSAPQRPLHVFANDSDPQPARHRLLEGGMATSVGRLRPCALFDYKFSVLSHNAVRGGAGGAILIAEEAIRQGLVPSSRGSAANALLSASLA